MNFKDQNKSFKRGVNLAGKFLRSIFIFFTIPLVIGTLVSSPLLRAQTNLTAASKPAEPAIPDNVVFEPDVIFGKGGTQDLHANIAYPKNATGPLPAVIYVHGGGWSGGNKKEGPVVLLAKNGFFAASIEYRLSGAAKWPAQIQDCKLAVRWVRANAAKFNVDPDHIGVWGGSAGGHLVACLGTMATVKEDENDSGHSGVSSAVQAVVDFFGPVDFTRSEIYPPSIGKATQALLGTTYEQNPELWKSASPLYSVAAGSPPMLLIHGDADDTVPLAQSLAFDEALTKAGVPHQLVVVKNGHHGFHLSPGEKMDPNWGTINKTVIEFFKKYLVLPKTA